MWGNRNGYYVADRLPGTAIPVLSPPMSTSTNGSTGTASERFWRQIRLITFGLIGVGAGVGSLALYRHNSDSFLIASTAFTLIYTLLTLFSSLRGQNQGVNNVDWNHAIEALSYFQLFNTFFVMLCVVDITFKTKSSRSSSSSSSYGRSSQGNSGSGSGNGNGNGNSGQGDGR